MFWTDSSEKTTPLLPFLIAIILIQSVTFAFSVFTYLSPSGEQTLRAALMDHEYAKVGGKATYDILARAQLLSLTDKQNPSNLERMKEYIKSFDGTSPEVPKTDTVVPTPPVDKTLPESEIKTIKDSAVIEGSSSAQILVVEYSDMECPFCLRQYHQTKLQEKLQAEFGDKVAFSFKNNRWVDHKGTEVKALWALCAEKLGGKSAYIKFYKWVMDKSTNEGGVLPVTELSGVAKASGVDVTKWQSCVDAKETLARFTTETREAQKFDLWGTPGTLILNLSTGKYDTVEGAFPYDTFAGKIQSLLK